MSFRLLLTKNSRLTNSTSVFSQKHPRVFSSDQKKLPRKDGEVTKEDLQWRIPQEEIEDRHTNILRAFRSKKSYVDLITAIRMFTLRPSAIKKWWEGFAVRREIASQLYIPARHDTLGNELAAAHFIVFRGGRVKFFNEDVWIKCNEFKEYDLPKFFDPSKIVRALDCSGVNLYYEGLVNISGLQRIEWLSLNGCPNIDDWCMDRICGLYRNTLQTLDVRNCPLVTERGIGALYRMKALHTLYVSSDKSEQSRPNLELTCLMLQEVKPNLEIHYD